jgi:RNA polymerase sigma-32 factor
VKPKSKRSRRRASDAPDPSPSSAAGGEDAPDSHETDCPELTAEEAEGLSETHGPAPGKSAPASGSGASEVRLSRVSPTGALQIFMRDVGRHPLLTAEEEHALAVRYRETGDVDAAYRLVTANLRLVVKIAHEYRRSAFALADLVQEGNVGLMHAVKKFDPYRGVKLSTYAAWWIRAYIIRYTMENWSIVKLGTTQAQRKLFFNLRKAQEKLAAQGFELTPKLLAERLEVSEQDIVEMDQRMSGDEHSLDAPLSEGAQTTRLERVASPSQPADERLSEHQLREVLKARLGEFATTLADKERFILEKRLVAEDPLTLQEIGDRYGVTRERARQLEAKVVGRLKEWVRRSMPDFKELEIGVPKEE